MTSSHRVSRETFSAGKSYLLQVPRQLTERFGDSAIVNGNSWPAMTTNEIRTLWLDRVPRKVRGLAISSKI